MLAGYADDLVVMCWSRSQAEAALERLTALLAGLGLEPKAAKTRIVVRHEAARSEWIRRSEAADVGDVVPGQCSRACPRPHGRRG